MNKNIKLFGLLTVGLLLITGCGTIPTLENGQEAVITLKDGKKISVDELYEEVKENYALEALISLTDRYIFETEFEDKKEDGVAYAESYIESMLTSYGTEEDLLMAIQQSTNFTTIEAYQDYIYLSYLQNLAIEKYAEEQITDDQVEKYYNDEAKGDVEISHILVAPSVSTSATDEEIASAEEAAKSEINDIIAKLNESDNKAERFAELAKEYSDDAATKEDGGSLGQINYHELSDAYDEIIDAAHNLSDGSYSTEIITSELGYHVIFKTKTHEKESLEDLTDEIRTVLAEDLMATDTALSFEALKYFRELYEFDIIDSDLGTQYNTYLKNIQAQLNTPTE